MKAIRAVLTVVCLSVLSGCGADEPVATAAPSGKPADVAAPGVAAASAPPGRPAAPRAPAFAVVPIDGAPDGPAVTADGPDGPGGMLTYVTAAAPDAAVDFHRRHAESAGLATVMTMNQGEARAYGAAAQDGSGAGLQVVASPVAAETGGAATSVTLTWTAGG
jgi:hypothetical protein